MVIKCLLVRANITSGKQCPSSRTPAAQQVVQQASAVPGLNNVHALDPSAHDPNNFFLTWEKEPQNILVVKKPGAEAALVETFAQICAYLLEQRKRVVYVEEPLLTSKPEGKIMKQDATFQRIAKQLRRFKSDNTVCNECINFIVCVGEEHAASDCVCRRFTRFSHPISVGKLPGCRRHVCGTALNGDCHLILRSRIKCFICTRDSLCSRASHARNIDADDSSFQYNALNEVVVQRKGPYISALDIFVDGKFVTCMQGDGLIISTTTGSTAYSLAAGASMIHPSVPALLLTPICAHSLSFRPVVMPAGCDVTIMLSAGARDGAVVTVDGRLQKELEQGDSLRATTSLYPLPSVCRKDPVSDWFDSLKVGLNWNQRPLQKPFETVSNSTSGVSLYDSMNSVNSSSTGNMMATSSSADLLLQTRSESASGGNVSNDVARHAPAMANEPTLARVKRSSGVATYHRGASVNSSSFDGENNSSYMTSKSVSHNDLPASSNCPQSYIITNKEQHMQLQQHNRRSEPPSEAAVNRVLKTDGAVELSLVVVKSDDVVRRGAPPGSGGSTIHNDSDHQQTPTNVVKAKRDPH